MKSDISRLMAERDLQAIVIAGDETYSAARDYLSNGAHVTGGLVLQKRDSAPVMIVNAMEIEAAAESGLEVLSYYDLDYSTILKESAGNYDLATVHLWLNALKKFDVPAGKIGIYGAGDLNVYVELIQQINNEQDEYQFVGERGLTLFDEAMTTKDSTELERIKSVADRTNKTLQATWDFIASHRAEGDTVVNAEGKALTIGEVKRFVRRTLLDYDLEDTGMIFAQGRDGGFPHSRGQDDMALQTGQAIVFDLFPREVGGGYHHDLTRTWSIGHATEEVQTIYNTVLEAFDRSIAAYEEVGQPAYTLQETVLDFFEADGHETQRSHPGTMQGYVHSLGHGVGLNIHERPSISHLRRADTLQIGNVITIEPGLYYPEKGYGVRIEDSFYIDENGALVALTDFHKELVLPLKG